MVVGMVGTSAWGGLIAALRRFSEQSAGVTWSLNELTPSQQIAALQKRHIDIGVWREAQQQTLPGLTCQRLASESIAVVLPLDHPLAQQENIPLAALQNDSFIVLPPHEPTWGCICTICVCSRDSCRTSLIRSTSRKPCWRWWRKAAALRCCRTATAAFRGPASALLAATGAAGGSVCGLPRRQRHAGSTGLSGGCGRHRRPAAQITSSAAPSTGRRCRDRPFPASGCNTGTGSVRR